MPVTPAWLAAIEAVLNRGIESSAQAAAIALRLNQTALRVNIGVIAVRASVTGRRLALMAGDEPADATITGSPLALAQLARGSGARSANIAAAQDRGDAEIANLYSQLFALARPDLEEELSRIVGDLPARRLSQFARQALAWIRSARRTTGENIAEYLQEESRDLVNKPELEEFLHGVDALRETAARVEDRIQRLEQRLKGSA